MSKQFQGKTANVTGAASGIGKAIALALGAEGANLVINDLKLESAQTVADELSQPEAARSRLPATLVTRTT